MHVEPGFHQDTYLLELINRLVKKGKISTFIETGSFEGRTLTYFATKYPNITCFSCEPDQKRFNIANNKVLSLQNVKIFN